MKITTRDGSIFVQLDGGGPCFWPREQAERQAAHFEAIPPTDWFHKTAQRHARALRKALWETENMEDAA